MFPNLWYARSRMGALDLPTRDIRLILICIAIRMKRSPTHGIFQATWMAIIISTAVVERTQITKFDFVWR